MNFDISVLAKYLPTVNKPTYKQPFNTRIKWTGVALLLYFGLSSITVYGISAATFEQFRFYEIVLGSKFGSLMTLGIGPIVTAGILLQLLVGSKIIDWDTSKPEGRKKFQTWNKFLGVVFCFIEGVAFVLAGAIPVIGGLFLKIFVMCQLALGGVIVILLDELVSKWGFGSGISLFIAAGITSQIIIRLFSPFTATCIPGQIGTCLPAAGSPPAGLVWNFLSGIFVGDTAQALTNLAPIAATAFVFALVVYAQDISVDIPLAFSAVRGFGRSWSLKLFYTSNIPVILTAAVLANLQLIGRMGVTPGVGGLSCGWLGCFDAQGQPVNGIIYYLTAPNNLLINLISLNVVPLEFLRALTHTIFMCIFAMIFSVFWVSTSGMDAASVAEQIEGIGMQIPGYRRDRRVIESVLNRYIPALAVLGGLAIGLLASFADITGALGTGTGMLLTVMIIYNYYEELRRERIEEAHPMIRRVFGG